MVERFKPRNEVKLVGRVSSIQGEKKLPSGDRVFEFRIVIDRVGRAPTIDVIDIGVWRASLRKKSTRLEVENWVEIMGSLRRRFWQGPEGLASRWQVEAANLRFLRR